MRKAFFILCCSSLLLSYTSSPRSASPDMPQYVKDFNAGVEAQKDRDYQVAIQYYMLAIGQKEDFADAWNNLGYCYRMVAKSYLAKSGGAYDKALKYAPKNELALEYQGEYFVMEGKLKNAYQDYLTLQRMGSDKAKDLKAKLDPVLKEAQEVLKGYVP